MLWIILTATAAPLQVARNALQRGLFDDAGPWGATLVRFLFGLPFSAAIFAVVALMTPNAHPSFGAVFWASAAFGGLAQVGATASLFAAMRRAGFGVATALQQSSLPFAAVLGVAALGDQLSGAAWAGVAAATAGWSCSPGPPASRRVGLSAGRCSALPRGRPSP